MTKVYPPDPVLFHSVDGTTGYNKGCFAVGQVPCGDLFSSKGSRGTRAHAPASTWRHIHGQESQLRGGTQRGGLQKDQVNKRGQSG